MTEAKFGTESQMLQTAEAVLSDLTVCELHAMYWCRLSRYNGEEEAARMRVGMRMMRVMVMLY